MMEDEGGKDEKLVAVAVGDPFYEGVRDIKDLPIGTVKQIAHFFSEYERLESGKFTRVEGWRDAAGARALIERTHGAFKEKHPHERGKGLNRLRSRAHCRTDPSPEPEQRFEMIPNPPSESDLLINFIDETPSSESERQASPQEAPERISEAPSKPSRRLVKTEKSSGSKKRSKAGSKKRRRKKGH